METTPAAKYAHSTPSPKTLAKNGLNDQIAGIIRLDGKFDPGV